MHIRIMTHGTRAIAIVRIAMGRVNADRQRRFFGASVNTNRCRNVRHLNRRENQRQLSTLSGGNFNRPDKVLKTGTAGMPLSHVDCYGPRLALTAILNSKSVFDRTVQRRFHSGFRRTQRYMLNRHLSVFRRRYMGEREHRLQKHEHQKQ